MTKVSVGGKRENPAVSSAVGPLVLADLRSQFASERGNCLGVAFTVDCSDRSFFEGGNMSCVCRGFFNCYNVVNVMVSFGLRVGSKCLDI